MVQAAKALPKRKHHIPIILHKDHLILNGNYTVHFIKLPIDTFHNFKINSSNLEPNYKRITSYFHLALNNIV